MILFDEPWVGLAPIVSRVFEIIKELKAEGKTISWPIPASGRPTSKPESPTRPAPGLRIAAMVLTALLMVGLATGTSPRACWCPTPT